MKKRSSRQKSATRGELTERQMRALHALLVTRSRTEAARLAGVGERTLRGYLADEQFRAAYDVALEERIDAALEASKVGIHEAASALRDVVTDSDAPATARVSAARVVLDYLDRLTELRDVERRLRALEGAMPSES